MLIMFAGSQESFPHSLTFLFNLRAVTCGCVQRCPSAYARVVSHFLGCGVPGDMNPQNSLPCCLRLRFHCGGH